MSIYSGFATRFQEQSYDHCIDSLLYVLQKKIIRFYTGEPSDEEKFISVVLKLFQQMRKMERSKYLDPKSSESVTELVKFMQLYQHNIVSSSIPPVPQQPTLPQQPEQTEQPPVEGSSGKKASLFWVERVAKDEIAKLEMKEEPTKPVELVPRSIQKEPESSKDKKVTEFRRTNYQSNSIRGVKVKNTSRSNLSRDKDGSQPGASRFERPRSNSNYLHAKPQVDYSKMTYNESSIEQGGEMQGIRKFQNTSSNPHEIKPGATRSQAEDIIKEYIVKMKRQKKRGSRGSRGLVDF